MTAFDFMTFITASQKIIPLEKGFAAYQFKTDAFQP